MKLRTSDNIVEYLAEASGQGLAVALVKCRTGFFKGLKCHALVFKVYKQNGKFVLEKLLLENGKKGTRVIKKSVSQLPDEVAVKLINHYYDDARQIRQANKIHHTMMLVVEAIDDLKVVDESVNDFVEEFQEY